MPARGARRRGKWAEVLHFGKDQRPLHAAFGQLQRQLTKPASRRAFELNIANALWAQKGHPFLPDFLKAARANTRPTLAEADFKTDAEAARGKINQWVAQKTKDKIQNILPPRSLNELTRLVLANAIYFKGVWTKPYSTNRNGYPAVPRLGEPADGCAAHAPLR